MTEVKENKIMELENKNMIKGAMQYVNNLVVSLEKYYYHHYEHALDVMNRAIYLWEKEWLDKSDIEILALAWLFHDTWYVIEYDGNEKFWAKIAQNYLKTILYPSDKIEKIENIILATSPNYLEPKDILEKIIKDADMDNLWRDDFFKKWNDLKKEIEIVKRIKIKDPDWLHSALNLMKHHSFYTYTQNKERESKKIENEKVLEEIMNKVS